jgi:hypothetical protein
MAQNAVVRGVVSDKNIGILLENALVSMDHIHDHTHSDVYGVFVFSKLNPGTYEIEVEKAGYKKYSVIRVYPFFTH